ncbi:FAD-dependent oxidoreductase [Leuconostoc litchii]|uniref:Thioredoxin reductase n=1 Tax=Leuconostoc litchii TaxID=1981069 RepID=A0A6P2CQL8_9LACO|nr:FAD-dependent oxidoreductase [Leuconostoc litchii]TYC46637.1 thioredoxin reductase [Leuconostoc litchii]
MTEPHIYDTIIIGGGPAGLSAGIYAGRATLDTLIIESNQIGGQVTTTSTVSNYPAVETIDGTALVNKMQKQAEQFGVQFVFDAIRDYDFTDEPIKTVTGKKNIYYARSIIIATGAQPHKVGFKGEDTFRGRGVAYCSTCDGELFSGLEVFVIGGGYAAAEEADYLTRFARHVTIVMRSDDFTCPPLTADLAQLNPKITIWHNTEIISVEGQNYLTDATFLNNKTKEKIAYHVENNNRTFGIFVYVGTDPQTELFKDKINLDSDGYIVVNQSAQTNIMGVFAAGDVTSKPLRQIVTAASDGANAATSAEVFVAKQKRALNIPINRSTKKITSKNSIGETSRLDTETSPLIATHVGQWFSKEIIQSLKPIFNKLNQDIVLYQLTDDSAKSHELSSFLEEFSQLNKHIHFKVVPTDQELEEKYQVQRMPHFRLLTANYQDTGIVFSGIPTGHELNSLVLAIYNTVGPGQSIDEQLVKRIKKLPKADLTIGVSLNCHFCPDVVAACQHIAAINNQISAEMIDLQLFPDIREAHHIMSVPAMFINNSPNVIFGSQSLEEIVKAMEATVK